MKKMNVFKKHQFKIAKDTLKFTDAGANIMGGMTKEEARNFLLSIGWTATQINNFENK
jgi:hypothetical protein